MIIAVSGKMQSGKNTVGDIIQELTIDHIDYTSNWETKAFAGKLKDIVCLLVGCTREQLEDNEFKNTLLGEEWIRWRVAWDAYETNDREYFSSKEEAENFKPEYAFEGSIIFNGTWKEIKEERLTPRTMLQLLGTEAGRRIIHPNIWINALFTDYGNPVMQQWVITDLRFPNELQAVKQRGGITIRVERNTELRYPELWEDFQSTTYQDWNDYLKSTGQYYKVYHPSETGLDDAEFDYVIENNGTKEDLWEKIRVVLTQEKIMRP